MKPERAYRALLRLFPRSFRDESGREMERVFREMCVEWKEERGGLGPTFWMSVAWDTLRGALGAWFSLTTDVVRSETTRPLGEHMSTLLSDVRYALRQLVHEPLYSGMIVLLMTLGIAGNAAVFRVFNGLYLRPLPFDRSERLVDLDETAPSWDLDFLNIAYRDYAAWSEQNATFEAMAVYDQSGGNLVAGGAASRVTSLLATHTLDDVLGIEPVIGRFFGPEEDQPDGPRGALLTYGYWQQQFGADPGVIGQTVSINGRPYEILGVLPQEARFFGTYDLWLPLQQDRSQWFGWGLNGIGLLREGVTIEQARADLLRVHKSMIEQHSVNEISSPVVNDLRDRYLGNFRLGSNFLLGAVAIVLLIACANIAGLMYARSLARAPEIAVRTALGASRTRVVRQLLTESLVLALLGGGAGVALGVWGSGALVTPLASQFPNWVQFELDARFVSFTLAVTGAAALVFGLAPALNASARGAVARSGRSTGSISSRRGTKFLVAGEVGLALVLLVVGGLTMLDVRRLGQVDPGFEPEGLISYNVSLPGLRYDSRERVEGFVDEYRQRLEAIPGVRSATVASSVPLGSHWGFFLMAEGAPPRGEDQANPVVLRRIVDPGYFQTLGVQLVAGRTFDDFDRGDDTEQVVIVNETFVRTHLAHVANPLGTRVTPGTDMPGPDDDAEWWTIVGVTRDVKHYGLDREMRPGIYRPLGQNPLSAFTVALSLATPADPVIAAARALTAELDSELPIYSVQTMTERIDQSLYTRRATSWLFGAFSTIALLLAVAGIYGVISYSVGQRKQEISIRMAMGARREDVAGFVVRQGMALVLVGIGMGLLISLAGASRISGMLVGVSATTPGVYAGVSALLLAVAAVANWVPARRAAGLDPMRALRGE